MWGIEIDCAGGPAYVASYRQGNPGRTPFDWLADRYSTEERALAALDKVRTKYPMHRYAVCELPDIPIEADPVAAVVPAEYR